MTKKQEIKCLFGKHDWKLSTDPSPDKSPLEFGDSYEVDGYLVKKVTLNLQTRTCTCCNLTEYNLKDHWATQEEINSLRKSLNKSIKE